MSTFAGAVDARPDIGRPDGGPRARPTAPPGTANHTMCAAETVRTELTDRRSDFVDRDEAAAALCGRRLAAHLLTGLTILRRCGQE